jgi:chromosome segregation ATPase
MAYSFNEIIGSLALLISCGAAILLVRLLLSNTMQQEKFFNSLGRCHAELQTSSQSLETLCTILDRRFSNMEENSKQTDPLLINTLQRFDKVSKEIQERLDEMFLPGFSDTGSKPASDLPSEAVISEITKLQNSMAEIANQLRKSNYLSMDENAEIAAMRKRIESYQSMVMKARSEAKDSESIMAELRQEIKQLQTVKKSNPAESNNENQWLQEQLEEAERDKKALEERIKVLDNEMQRNNIEKKFIEDRFIELS